MNHVMPMNSVTERTIEEVIMHRAERKLQLSHDVIGDVSADKFDSDSSIEALPIQSQKSVHCSTHQESPSKFRLPQGILCCFLRMDCLALPSELYLQRKFVMSGCTTALNVVPWETDSESVLKEACPTRASFHDLLMLSLFIDVQAVEAWKHSDFLGHNYVLNGHSLYNVYCKTTTAKELWTSLERKHKIEDAGTKKFVVAQFLDYKMIDSKKVISQVQDLQVMLHDIRAEGMTLSKTFQVDAIIEKLPPCWVDFKNYLKYKRKEMNVEYLVVRLHIEEDNKQAQKNTYTPDSAKANMVEHAGIAVIMEYLVKLSKRHAFWSLNEDVLKIYDSDYLYAVSIKEDTTMDDPNMNMVEYIKLEEEKARKHGRVFNWKTATYGKIRVGSDLHDLRSMETEFPAIVIDITFTSQNALPCESKVSTLICNEIDFRISFDESDDEDYTIICDKNSFSYKMVSVNDLKTDSENDYEGVNTPLFQPPEPTTSYLDDLGFLNDFENEFPVIVYNDAKTSISDYLTEPTLCPQHINESDLKDETSFSEYDEEEQNVLYFNDLFPFNIIRPDDLELDEDNDMNQIDVIQSLEGNKFSHGSNVLSKKSHDKINKTSKTGSFVINLNVNIVIWNYYANEMLFYLIMNSHVPFGIPFDPKRYYKDGDFAIVLRRSRYQGLEYTEANIADFESRLARIYRREVHRVHVFYFWGLPDLMAEGLSARMLMEHRDAKGVSLLIPIE
ncbi:hypothetical protein Tco_0409290 [Tanacetum coccineum]